MKVTETFLQGCFVIEPTVYKDKRGDFFEVFNHKEFEEKIERQVNFIQDNQSISHKGVLRGLHLQKGKYAQAKLVRVVKGRVIDVVVDVRKESLTFGQYFSIELSGENNKQLFVPKGFLHGFVSLEDHTIFSYKCDNYYYPGAEDGVVYNDVDLAIDWKIKHEDIIITEKDKSLRAFSDFSKHTEVAAKTVITYGTFDLLHYGHIEILKRASQLGNRLIVGLSTDEFNAVKGKDCKISYLKRKEFLESIDFVDQIIPESHWEQKIEDVLKVKADIFVIGDDWKGKFDFLKEYCEVIYLPRTVDISTTKLKKAFNNDKE